MASFTISDDDFASLQGKFAVVTGASSGIGLATVKRLLQHGAKVYAADMNEMPEPERSQVGFSKVDVRSWKEQSDLFKAAKEKFGKIHHVFANAGISPKVTLLEEDTDENGDLLPPKLDVIDVNLVGVMYTVKLAIHYIRQHDEGGSIVMTGSGSSFSRFSTTDYTASKHAVFGLLRSLYRHLSPALPIRINAIAPSWTATGIVSTQITSYLGEGNFQTPDVVARSVLKLFADEERHGQMVYSCKGQFWDIEGGENGLVRHNFRMLGEGYEEEEIVVEGLKRLAKEQAAAAKDGKAS
ncbi:NAD(P)-binding protein [Aaosphaeria arxii CBS 175.79]|uniref:NAD(P)-binding protein n=1 Tax=Aaosphaeria arxii CBS 175.79 TaxID=1450172 RepID=A0A6A5XYH8_9PLEO|nr:NAD(P)-binding protein [Aaosphaeria arxii CBS 175.79]KAF2017983.1 NAD(P)-binding protein [Aaosphaeria arxii CBS 175.79]